MEAADSPGDDVIRHVRLFLDFLCTVSSIFFLRVLFLSNIRGTHSFRVLIHSAVSDLLLCAFSAVMYFLHRTAASARWKLYVASRLQTTFIMASFYCDFMLIVNISLAVTLGVTYKVKVTGRNITSGLVASWIVASLVGIYALTISLANILPRVGTEVIVTLSVLVSFFALVVPAGSIMVLFRRISICIRAQASTQALEIRAILEARLEFVRVLKILLGVRVLLYSTIAGVTISMKYFGLSHSFDILIASNVAYSICRVVIYLYLKKPLKVATERAAQEFCTCWGHQKKRAKVVPINTSVDQTQV